MNGIKHRHALRHLDTDLIERIESSGSQAGAPKRMPRKQHASGNSGRAASSYRGAPRNARRELRAEQLAAKRAARAVAAKGGA